jgi:hypothetical protein
MEAYARLGVDRVIAFNEVGFTLSDALNPADAYFNRYDPTDVALQNARSLSFFKQIPVSQVQPNATFDQNSSSLRIGDRVFTPQELQ